MGLQLLDASSRLFIGYFIEDVAIGRSFPRSDWPLHVTIIPWFLCDQPEKLDFELSNITSSFSGFDVQVSGEAMFGSKKNIKVNLIEPNSQLTKMHNSLLTVIKDLGRIDVDEQFTGDGYRPHVTHVKDRRAGSGDRLSVGCIYLTELSDERSCTPLKRYELRK